MFIYTKYIATFSVYGGRIWLLVITIAVFAGGSLVLSWKIERNWLSPLSGTILPVLVFEVISMWKYSLVIRIVSIIIGIIAITLGIIWASKKVSQIKRVNAIIPAALEQGDLKEVFIWASFSVKPGFPQGCGIIQPPSSAKSCSMNTDVWTSIDTFCVLDTGKD